MEMKLNPHPHLHSLFLNQLSKYDQVVKSSRSFFPLTFMEFFLVFLLLFLAGLDALQGRFQDLGWGVT